MGVYKRGRRSWWITYTINGKQRHEAAHTHSKRLAQKLLDIRKAEIAEGRLRLPKSNPPRLEDWAKEFLESIQHQNTRRRYRSSVHNLTAFFKDARLSQVTPDRIEEFKQARLKAGAGSATVNRDLAVLRRMLKLAQRRRLIGPTPFEEVEFLEERKNRRQPHILTFEEQDRLLAVSPPLLRTLIVLITETGLRVNKEALPLKWEDVDLLNEAIYVCQSKTLAGRRSVPLSDFCKCELLNWRNLVGPDFSPNVFFNSVNPERQLKDVRKPWRKALEAAKVEYLPIYNLRAAFASRLSAAGVPDVFVAQLIGHSTPSALQMYARVIDDTRRNAIGKLEEFRKVQIESLRANLYKEGKRTEVF